MNKNIIGLIIFSLFFVSVSKAQDSSVGLYYHGTATDFNSMTKYGIYRGQGSSLLNGPAGNNHATVLNVGTFNSGGSYGFQFASELGGNRMFYRTFSSVGNYNSWYELIHSGNLASNLNEISGVGVGTIFARYGSLQIKTEGVDGGINLWTGGTNSWTSRIWIDDTKRTFHITKGSNPKNGITISQDGNIGIGTDEPSYKLAVHGDTGIQIKSPVSSDKFMTIKPRVNVSGLNPGGSTEAAQITNLQYQHLVFDIKANDVNDAFAIRTDSNLDGSVDKVSFVVKPKGETGIGVVAPKDILHVVDSEDSALRLSSKNYYGGSNNGLNQVVGRIKFSNQDRMGYQSEIRGVLTGGWANNMGISFSTPHHSNVTEQVERMRITHGGNVGIGTIDPGDWKLAVNGEIRAKEIKVETGWSDFVFYDDYKLPTLREVEQHIKEKGHLKDIPSAKEVEENGIYVGEMNSKLLQKIEELTLYTIEQQKKIEYQEEQLKEMKSIKDRLAKLEALLLKK